MNTRIEQLLQIYDEPTWDGDLISKAERDALWSYGLILRNEYGFNVISSRGESLCLILRLRDVPGKKIEFGGSRHKD